ncbi:hypothetical protein T4B_11186 [Trichinella pseudospiralis]|uniref:Uncharacterized protein n=1 Tax=Trichinella pseudospiralis TaxID=6337 RepID=A0A0V1IPL4_TRIPS|nr:hypothetical protein T4B_11186 [Trichinella pseudospiralis]
MPKRCRSYFNANLYSYLYHITIGKLYDASTHKLLYHILHLVFFSLGGEFEKEEIRDLFIIKMLLLHKNGMLNMKNEFLSETNRVKYNTVSIIYSFKEVSMKSTRSCSNRQISFQAASFGKAGFVAHAVQSKEENFIIVFCIIGVCLKKTQQQQRQQQQQQIFMSLGDVGKVVPRYSLVNFAKLCCPCLRKKPIK